MAVRRIKRCRSCERRFTSSTSAILCGPCRKIDLTYDGKAFSAASEIEVSDLCSVTDGTDSRVFGPIIARDGHINESFETTSSVKLKSPIDNDFLNNYRNQTISFEKKRKTPQKGDGEQGKPAQLDITSQTQLNTPSIQSPGDNDSVQLCVDTAVASSLALQGKY
ncbi:hypothetical protein ACHAXS_012097 [Conticribra weissflogii]